jgi:hypothetical protein
MGQPLLPDPFIKHLKQDVDCGLLREALRLSPEQRLPRLLKMN